MKSSTNIRGLSFNADIIVFFLFEIHILCFIRVHVEANIFFCLFQVVQQRFGSDRQPQKKKKKKKKEKEKKKKKRKKWNKIINMVDRRFILTVNLSNPSK